MENPSAESRLAVIAGTAWSDRAEYLVQFHGGTVFVDVMQTYFIFRLVASNERETIGLFSFEAA